MIKSIATGLLASVLWGGAFFGAYAALARAPSGNRDLAAGATLEIAPAKTPAGGRVFIATVPLDAARWDLFLTPRDAGAPADHELWTHRLAHTGTVASDNTLAVAINASMFKGGSWPIRRVGEIARATETTVAAGEVVRRWEHSYMLGFLSDLTPVPTPGKPPPPDMSAWRFGVSAQSWQGFDGKQAWWEQGKLDRRTVVGVSTRTRTLFLGVVEHATLASAADELMSRGATHVFNLDGGESSTLTVNGHALTGDWRPVANHFGAKAK